MGYAIEFRPRARREFRKLPHDVKLRLTKAISRLENEPRPQGCRTLKGEENAYRIRVGSYRLLYQVHDDKLLVLIVRAGHRKEVYNP